MFNLRFLDSNSQYQFASQLLELVERYWRGVGFFEPNAIRKNFVVFRRRYESECPGFYDLFEGGNCLRGGVQFNIFVKWLVSGCFTNWRAHFSTCF
jgi:hypothetical protein